MEVQIRIPCETCKGTQVLEQKESKPRMCTICKDGYTYSWVELHDVPMLQAHMNRSKKRH